MLRRISSKITTGLAMLALLFLVSSCKTTSRDEKFYEKQEEKMQKMEEMEYEKAVKELRRKQSESTLKMMRETERQSKKWNKPRKR
jgi:Flp pilus assembly protein TadD